MLEWMMVVAFGGLGGAIAMAFGERVRPKKQSNPTELSTFWQRIQSLLLNIAGGAVVSFILWGTYISNLTFNSTRFTPAEIVASLLAGLGGVGGVRGYLHESHEARRAENAADNTADALAELSNAKARHLEIRRGLGQRSCTEEGQHGIELVSPR